MRPLRVMHFAEVINHADFIDTVVRFAEPDEFTMMACTMSLENNIAPTQYAGTRISHFTLTDHGTLSLFASVRRLAAILRRERVDVLHAHHFRGALMGRLASWLARTPFFVVGRQYHDEIYLLTRGLKRRILLAIEAVTNFRASAIVVPSAPVRQLLVERQGLDSAVVHVAPYGFDFSEPRYASTSADDIAQLRREFGLTAPFVIGNFARHHPLKGQDDLLRAFASFTTTRRAQLLLVGDGPAHGALRALAAELGLLAGNEPPVVFAGWRRDASRLMEAVDVVVHPALHESFCQTMVEALAHARPLVITHVAGPSDHVVHGQNGYVIAERDPRDIERALEVVFADRPGAAAWGTAGEAYVRTELAAPVSVRRYEQLYRRLAARAPA